MKLRNVNGLKIDYLAYTYLYKMASSSATSIFGADLGSVKPWLCLVAVTTNQKIKYFEKDLAFSQASWAVSAIFFVIKENKRKISKNIYK